MDFIFMFILVINDAINMISSNTANEVETLFHNYWEFKLRSDPQFATTVGEHRFNDKLNNYTIAHFENLNDQLIQFQNQAEELLKYSKENSKTQSYLELLINEIQYRRNLFRIKRYFFPISFLHGPPKGLFRLLSYQTMKTKNDCFNLVKRYKAFPRQAEEIISTMREGIKMNMVHHVRSLKNYEKTILKLTSVPPKMSVFYEPFKNLSSYLSSTELDECTEAAEKSISEYLNLGLQALADFVTNEYRQHTRKDIASSSLPNGHDFYNTWLNLHVSDNVSPQLIHDMGLKEVERIAKEMKDVIHSLGSQQSLHEFNNLLRSNDSMFFKTPEEALNTYTDFIRSEIEPKLPQYFKKIPKDEVLIKRVPDEFAGGASAFYRSPAPDGFTKGTFFIDTSNLKNTPKHVTATLSLHEAVPGHHFQTVYANELEGLPMFIKYKQYSSFTAFSEGWALYSEYLGKEMGLFTDKYMLYGHLSQEIFRACRMVVDTGMHALGWSREQAIKFMLKNTASSEDKINIEVDRYITWPGQACSYKYGEMKIKSFRSRAEEALGSKFDIKEFHDVILSNRSPMSFLKKQVEMYIASTLG